ncbi:hypothetical protein GCM10022255_040310 [Dactylosporangium darangshiense]|uniref:Secreted protein n=1 Tax=Dactylosporangium darangshiense TaxID=579108 RepID=A0ABP8D9N8_9ACTN
MGRHERRRTACVVRDPRRVARARWWLWLLPLCGLALWPLAPVAAFLAAGALVFGVGGLVRYRVGAGIRLEGDAARDWARGADLLREIRRGWPALGGLAEPADIRPTLARTGYHLAKLVAARVRMEAYAAELRAARDGLPAGDLRDEADERSEAAADRARDLDAQLAARLAALGRLAASLDGHERDERVRALLAAGPPALPDPGPDPIAEVEGRTVVVLAAYRELSGLRPSPSETRS